MQSDICHAEYYRLGPDYQEPYLASTQRKLIRVPQPRATNMGRADASAEQSNICAAVTWLLQKHIYLPI